MTITKKPTRAKKTEEKRDAIASAFIQAAEHRAQAEAAVPPKPEKSKTEKAEAPAKAEKSAKVKKAAPKKIITDAAAPVETTEIKEKKSKDKGKKKNKDKKKEAVIIRFEDAQLAEIDSNADALGLSRAAWVRMVVSQALAKS
jgi:predicted DNA binding CopG/RHH family protein